MARGIEIGTAYLSLTVDGSGLGRSIQQSANGRGVQTAGRSIGQRVSSGMKKALKVGAIATGAAVAGVLGTALTKGFQRLNAIDEAKKKLAGLGNSSKDIGKIMKNALASVKGTAFGLDEAATVAASAVAAGIKPGAQLEGVLKTVADTATIAGASMGDMGAIFGSVAARGKLQGDDLMQLQSRGVPVLAFLAKHYHITAKAASDMVSKGKVDFKNFEAAMKENLGGAAKKSGDTVKGAFANLKASLGRIGANLLSGVFPKIAPGLMAITKAMGPLEDKAGALGSLLGGKISAGFSILKRGADGALQIFKMLFNNHYEEGPIGPTSKLIPLIFDLRDAVTKAWGTIRPWLSNFAFQMGATLSKVGPALSSIGSFLLELWRNAQPFVHGAIVAAFAAFRVALVVIPPIVSALFSGIKGVFDFLKPLAPAVVSLAVGFVAYKTAMLGLAGAQKIVALATRAWAAAQALINVAMSANPVGLVIVGLAALAAGLYLAWTKSETFRKIVTGTWNGIKSVASAVFSWFTKTLWPGMKRFFSDMGSAFTATGKAISGTWKSITGAFSSAWSWVSGVFRKHWLTILGILTGPIGLAVTQIIKHWGSITGAFSGAWNWVKSTFKSAWSGVKHVVMAPIDGAKSAASTSWGKITGYFWAAWNWVKSTFKSAWNGLKSVIMAPINGVHSLIDRQITGWKNLFRGAKDSIGKIWGAVKALFEKPITATIRFLGGHFSKPINAILSKVGLGKYSLPTFGAKTGAILPGYTPGRDVHRFYSPTAGGLNLSGGEAIMRPEWTRAIGASNVNAMNAAARNGGIGGVRRALGFAGGGVWGKVKGVAGGIWNAVSSAWDVLTDPKKLIDKLLGKIGGSWPGMVAKGALSHVWEGLKSLVGAGGPAGGPGVAGGPKAPRSGLAWSGIEWYRPAVLGALKATLRNLQRQGWSILEMPGFGPVHRVHSRNSLHYLGQAADISFPGMRGGDQVAQMLAALGYGTKWRVPGHFNHIHVDTSILDHMYGRWTHVPGYANGGVARPGLVRVGERGPELLQLGSTSRIYSNAESRGLGGPVRLDPRDIKLLASELRAGATEGTYLGTAQLNAARARAALLDAKMSGGRP